MSPGRELLTEVLRQRRGALVGYAHLFTADRARAEDLVHDAVVRTFARERSLRDVGAAEAYLRRAIRSAFLDGDRRGRRWLAAVPSLVPRTGPGDVADRAAATVDVAAALSRLTPRQRAVVVLRFHDDLPLAEVAAELGLGLGTVKRYLHDATARLREDLGVDLSPDDDLHQVPVSPSTSRDAS